MEITIILTAFVAFVFLAARYGYDSRDMIPNKEVDFVRYGYNSDTVQYEQRLADEIQAARLRQSQPADITVAA